MLVARPDAIECGLWLSKKKGVDDDGVIRYGQSDAPFATKRSAAGTTAPPSS